MPWTESGRALALDPVSPGANGNRAMICWRARRYDDAIEPANWRWTLIRTSSMPSGGKASLMPARVIFRSPSPASPKAAGIDNGPAFRALLGHVYGRAGDTPKARGMLAELATMSSKDTSRPSILP